MTRQPREGDVNKTRRDEIRTQMIQAAEMHAIDLYETRELEVDRTSVSASTPNSVN